MKILLKISSSLRLIHSLLSGAFLATSAFLLVILSVFELSYHKKVKSYQETNGTIVDLLGGFGGTGHRIIPLINYEVDGNPHEFKSDYYSTDMNIGDNITILYDKNNPDEAVVKESLYFLPSIFGFTSAVFAILSAIFFISSRIIKKRSSYS